MSRDLRRGEGWCWHFLFVNLDTQGVLVLTFQEQQYLESFEEGSKSQQLCCHGCLMHLLWLFHSILWSSHLMLLVGLSLLERDPFLCGPLAQGGGNWLAIVSSTVSCATSKNNYTFHPSFSCLFLLFYVSLVESCNYSASLFLRHNISVTVSIFCSFTAFLKEQNSNIYKLSVVRGVFCMQFREKSKKIQNHLSCTDDKGGLSHEVMLVE